MINLILGRAAEGYRVRTLSKVVYFFYLLTAPSAAQKLKERLKRAAGR